MQNEIKFEAGSREQIKVGSKAARFLRMVENELPARVNVQVRVEPLSIGSPTTMVFVRVSNPDGASFLRWRGIAHFAITEGRKTSFRTYRASERVSCSRSFTLGARFMKCPQRILTRWIFSECETAAKHPAVSVR